MLQKPEPYTSQAEQAVLPTNGGREQPSKRGIDFQTRASQAGKPEGDAFDRLCHLAFNAPMLTRRQRADRPKQQPVAFFKFFAPETLEIQDDLPGDHNSRQRTTPVRGSNSWQYWERRYASDGEPKMVAVRNHLPDVLKLPRILNHGNVNEIIGKFGGADQLRNAVNQLQTLPHAA